MMKEVNFTDEEAKAECLRILSKDGTVNYNVLSPIAQATWDAFERGFMTCHKTNIIKSLENELIISNASDVLRKRHYNIQVIREELRTDGVWFEFYIAAHDYSAGRDSDFVKFEEIPT